MKKSKIFTYPLLFSIMTPTYIIVIMKIMKVLHLTIVYHLETHVIDVKVIIIMKYYQELYFIILIILMIFIN